MRERARGLWRRLLPVTRVQRLRIRPRFARDIRAYLRSCRQRGCGRRWFSPRTALQGTLGPLPRRTTQDILPDRQTLVGPLQGRPGPSPSPARLGHLPPLPLLGRPLRPPAQRRLP